MLHELLSANANRVVDGFKTVVNEKKWKRAVGSLVRKLEKGAKQFKEVSFCGNFLHF